MKYLGTISNSQDIITKGWITKNIADVIPDGSITADKLADGAGGSSDFRAVEVYNPALTKANDTFTWNIEASEHKMLTSAVSIVVYDANGKLISCDVGIDSSLKITISIYDASSATTVAEKTYKAVIIGLKTPTTDEVSTLITDELAKKENKVNSLSEFVDAAMDDSSNCQIPFSHQGGSTSTASAPDIVVGAVNFLADNTAGYLYGGNGDITSEPTIPVSGGGTGATDAAGARTNLGITPANIGALATSGGTVTGQISKAAAGSSFVGARNTATIRNTDVTADQAFFPVTSSKTPSGSYEMGTLGESMYFSYITDENYNADSNVFTLTEISKDGVMKCNGLYVNGLPYHQTYSGTSVPATSLGNDGDVYFKYTT